MNENQEQTSNVTRRGVGRPRTASITRTIRLDKKTMAPLGKGRISHGTEIVEVQVQRCITASEYVHGTTPIVGNPTEKTIGPTKAAAPANTVNVVVIEATTQETSEPEPKTEQLASAQTANMV